MATKFNLAEAMEKTKITQRIGRSIVYTVCNGHSYAGDEAIPFTDTLLGKWTARRATRLLRREHGDDSITIVKTLVYKQYCDMDLLEFWLNARATSAPVLVSETHIND